jgi:hypothetical protein
LAGAALLAAGSGCASVSTFHSGKTLPPGQVQIGTGVGWGFNKIKTKILDYELSLPSGAWEFWARAGVWRFLEAGVKLAYPKYGMVETRAGILKEERGWPISAALGIGYGVATVRDFRGIISKSLGEKTRVYDLSTGLYLSRDMSSWMTLYASPRYVHRKTRNTRAASAVPGASEIFDDDMAGTGVGVILSPGKIFRLMLEYNRLVDTNEHSHRQTFTGMGMDFRFGAMER